MASISWGTCRGRSIALRVQAVRTVKRTKWSIPIFKCHVNFYFYLCIACWKLRRSLWLWFGVPDGTAQRIGFWNTPTPSRVLQTMGAICKKPKLKQQFLAWHYQCGIWFAKHRNRFWGAATQLAAIFTRYGCWNSKCLEEHITLA